MAAPPAVQNTSQILSKLCKTTLKHSKSVDKTRELVIQTEDKLSIFLRHRNLFVVYIHRDGALAVLEDVDFQQRNPPVISCRMKYDSSMEGAQIFLSYAVVSGMNPKGNELVLIMSWLWGDYCIGITKKYKVKQFHKKNVKLLTKPRKLLKEGMMLRMKSDVGEVLELFKTPKTVFGWQTKEGVQHQLGQFEESCPEKYTSPRTNARDPEDDLDEETPAKYPRHIKLLKRKSSLDPKGNPPPPLLERIPPQSAPPLSTPQEFEDTSLRFTFHDSGDDLLEDSYDTVPATRGPSSCRDPEGQTGSTYRHSESSEAVAVQLLDESFQDTETYQDFEAGYNPSDMIYIQGQTGSTYRHSESSEAVAVQLLDESFQDTETYQDIEVGGDPSDMGEMKRDHWFKGRMSREKAEQLLTHEGDYLFRYRGGHSNNIVLSHRIEMDRVDHLEVIKNLNTETLHQLTPLIEERILHFARSNGMRFQDDQPIRLGGGPKEKEYMTFNSDYANKNPTIFKTSFEQRGEDHHYYDQHEQPNVQYEEISNRYGNEQVTQAACETLADHLPKEKLDEFGKILRIPRNIRQSILETENTVQETSSRLMGVWLGRKGRDATVKELLDALRRLGYEETEILLEDLYENLEVQDNS